MPRDKETLDFLDSLRKDLGDTRPKSFGLYVRLLKQYGRKKLEWAYKVTSSQPIKDKLPYFIAVVRKGEMPSFREKQKRVRKEKVAPASAAEGDALARYHRLRAKLLRKMTPKYERVSRTRSRLHLKVAREERKLRRGPKARK